MPGRKPLSESPAAVRAEALQFRDDMREDIRDIRRPGSVSPEVFADRHYEITIEAAGRRWQLPEMRALYLGEVRAQVRADLGMSADPDPLYERFLTRLLERFDEARKGRAERG